jgi:uncharacterized protein
VTGTGDADPARHKTEDEVQDPGIRQTLGRRVVIVSLAAVALLGAATIGAVGWRGAAAQDATPVPTTETLATVSVGGHGAVTIAPDTASVVVGVNVIETTLSAAQEKATAQMTAVINALKAAGIDEKDIQTVNYSVSIIQDHDENGNPTVVKGFQVTNQVNVTVRDLDKLGAILDAVVAQGANSIYGISLYVNDPSAAASQARTAAVKDAKAKADELAAAAGMTVGRVLSISESYSPPPAPMEVAGGAADTARASVPIQGGTTMVAVDVQVIYELV